ncbi:MAG: NAD(P)/FAD-dependent oxidoreductase [Vicingaceae bacterium]
MPAHNIPNLSIPRIVILGGGFAGLKLARSINTRHYQVVLIDQNNYHTFQPLLYQVATAGLEPDSIAYPLRKTLKNKAHTHIRMAAVESIDLESKEVLTSIGKMSYSYLVIATGAETNYFGNEQIEKFAVPMKSLTESLDLRSLILQNFESSLNQKDLNESDSLMNFVVVGGGPTGVELAGALAELKKHVLPKDYPDLDIRRMQINLLEAAPRLLAAMSEKSSRYSLKYLERMGVNVYTDTAVQDYNGKVVKTNKEIFETRNLIWAAGVKGNVPKGIDEKYLERGRIKVNEFAQLSEHPEVFALGDVSIMFTKKFSKPLPMLGSVAQQQGSYLAKYFNRMARNQQVRPFEYSDKGTMATVGRNRAVVDLLGMTYGGTLAWLTWLFVHLMLLVDFRSRIMVFINWVWNYIRFDRGTRLIVRKFEQKK